MLFYYMERGAVFSVSWVFDMLSELNTFSEYCKVGD